MNMVHCDQHNITERTRFLADLGAQIEKERRALAIEVREIRMEERQIRQHIKATLEELEKEAVSLIYSSSDLI